MSQSVGLRERWSRLRYERLLPRAAQSRAAGRRYAHMVATVELATDPLRRKAGVDRIARWQGASPAAAHGIYYESLVSEAQEEADTVFFMRDRDALQRWLPDRDALPAIQGPTVFVTLHFGNHILAYLYLRRVCGLDVRAIARRLGANNPMADAKRRYGTKKESWLDELAGVGFFDTDAASIALAREHLLDVGPIYAAIDVPGDVVSRSTEVEMGGERVAFSSGVVTLARLTRSTIVPMVSISGPERLRVYFGNPIEAAKAADPFAAVFAELEKFIHRFPEEWWLWSYVGPGPS